MNYKETKGYEAPRCKTFQVRAQRVMCVSGDSNESYNVESEGGDDLFN